MDRIEELLQLAKTVPLTFEQKHELARLIDELGKDKPKANYITACCPFHEEKTPSFTINKDTLEFRCFGCGEAGKLVKHA